MARGILPVDHDLDQVVRHARLATVTPSVRPFGGRRIRVGSSMWIDTTPTPLLLSFVVLVLNTSTYSTYAIEVHPCQLANTARTRGHYYRRAHALDYLLSQSV